MKDTYESSNKVSNVVYRGGEPKYPWRTMNVGTSFLVPYSEAKGLSLRSYASLMGKRTGHRFRVVDHGEAVGHEVARVE